MAAGQDGAQARKAWTPKRECETGPQEIAAWPRSPVRIRSASSTSVTKILPSPMCPVLARLQDCVDGAVGLCEQGVCQEVRDKKRT